MANHSSDEESSDSEAASQQSSRSSASSYSRQSSRSADDSSRGGSSASSSRSASTRSAASSRSSRSRSSRSSSSSGSSRSRQSSVGSRSFDIEDASEGLANVATQENNNNESNNSEHSDDDSVSSGPPTSASGSREGSSRSPFTEAESYQTRSEVSSKEGGGAGVIIIMNGMNGHSSFHSEEENHPYENGSGPVVPTPIAVTREGESALKDEESTAEMPTKVLDTKFIKIKLIDQSRDENTTTEEPIIVTMKIAIPTSQEPSWSDNDVSVGITEASVGIGQTVQVTFTDNDNDDQGDQMKMDNNKRVAIRQDESDRERIKEETDKVLSEIIEELSPGDVIARTHYDTVRPKNNRGNRPPLTTWKSSGALSTEKRKRKPRPPLTRRRSSVEMSELSPEDLKNIRPLRRRSSFESPPEGLKNNHPIPRRSSLDSSSDYSSPGEHKSNRPIRRRNSYESLSHDSSSVDSAPDEHKRKVVKGRSSAELAPGRRASHDSGPIRRASADSGPKRRASADSQPRRRASVDSAPKRRASFDSSPQSPQRVTAKLPQRRPSFELSPQSLQRGDLPSIAPSVESLPTPEKGLEPFIIPSLITSSVTKSDPNQKVGLAFRKSGGANTVIIDKITPTSPFQGSDLRSGHEILIINGHRVHSARRAAEVVRESRDSLTLVVSNAIRPPGAMYTMLSIADHRHRDVSSLGKKNNYVAGMYFKMKNGLVQLMKIDEDSPVVATSMRVGDFILAVNGKVAGSVFKVVDAFVESAEEDFIPVLYFNMRNLRATLVETNIGDRWGSEWSDYYDECTLVSPGSSPLTLKFKEDGMCELVDPLRQARGKSTALSPDNPLHPIVEAINHGTICLLSAIREGVKIATPSTNGTIRKGMTNSRRKMTENDRNPSMIPSAQTGEHAIQLGSDQLADLLVSGVLDQEDYRAMKSNLVA